MKRVRIVANCRPYMSAYAVQKRYWWPPFWRVVAVATTLEHARSMAATHFPRGVVVEYVE